MHIKHGVFKLLAGAAPAAYSQAVNSISSPVVQLGVACSLPVTQQQQWSFIHAHSQQLKQQQQQQQPGPVASPTAGHVQTTGSIKQGWLGLQQAMPLAMQQHHSRFLYTASSITQSTSVVQQQQQPHPSLAGSKSFASSSAAAATSKQSSNVALNSSPPSQTSSQPELMADFKQLDELLQVLMQPVPRTTTWNAQLSPYLVQMHDQLLLQPSAVLMSLVRALHVLRAVLQEDGQVYVVENNYLLKPLVKTAALSCINSNMWFYWKAWVPGSLTNNVNTRSLFKEAHQPNRRLFLARGQRLVNPLSHTQHDASAPFPRLSNQDKWLLYQRSHRPGFKQLLEELLYAEDMLHSFKPAGSLRGMAHDLSLLIVLDSTKNAVAIKEAYDRNIPCIAITNTIKDMSKVTYPVLARDFSPNFVHFFLDWIVKVANVKPMAAPDVAHHEDKEVASNRS